MAKDWNLPAGCLTDKDAQNAMPEYLTKDKTLFNKIEKQCRMVHGMSNSTQPEPQEADCGSNNGFEDETNVPLAQ
ncbi:hypothetical protein PQX77_012729 [Marasmius sp. AFHP31]|nr:hypothetical protein PQX77_012729 [Marasmius sp. AFHP31]